MTMTTAGNDADSNDDDNNKIQTAKAATESGDGAGLLSLSSSSSTPREGGMKLSFALSSSSSTKKTALASNNKNKTLSAFSSCSGGGGGLLGDDDEDGDDDDDENSQNHDHNNGIPKEPLVIQCPEDTRKSLQEQARLKRGSQEGADGDDGGDSEGNGRNASASGAIELPISTSSLSKEDQDAIDALKADAVRSVAAGGTNNHDDDNSKNVSSKNMIIKSSDDTFQRGGIGSKNNKDDDGKFQMELDNLAPTLSVQSRAYKDVPISQFGMAMLRGMGWKGNDGDSSNNDKNKPPMDETVMPRPSRLGLGATPKIMAEAGNDTLHATHSRYNKRRPLRQDELQKQERLKRQQEEFERNRQRQIALDKQQTLQIGSIVWIRPDDSDDNDDDGHRVGTGRGIRRRAMIRKLQGVPGLNMIMVQFDGESSPSKVKKGRLDGFVDRKDLHDDPFHDLASTTHVKEPSLKNDINKNDSGSRERNREEDKKRKDKKDRDKSSNHSDDDDDDSNDRQDDRRGSKADRKKKRRPDDDIEVEKSRDRDRERKRDRDRDQDRDRKRGRDHSSDANKGQHSKRHKESISSTSEPPKTWLIPNIRVRIISSKYGKRVYKEKGVVVDVTRDGKATLKMSTTGSSSSNEVLHVPERHLETALPKVGGNACILSGPHRFARGRLLERDSNANRGVVQLYEDMNVVAMSLDDIAEWCAPLDDDLAYTAF